MLPCDVVRMTSSLEGIDSPQPLHAPGQPNILQKKGKEMGGKLDRLFHFQTLNIVFKD